MRLLRWVGLLAGLMLWQGLCSAGIVGSAMLASPAQVCAGLWELAVRGMPPEFLLHKHVLHSLLLVGSGFLAALFTGVPLGLLLGGSRLARAVLEPVFEFFRPVPPLAWIPLSVLWLGIGFKSAVFIIFLGAFFPILVNTCSGVRNVSAGCIGVAEVLGASRRDIWLKVLLPASLPSILAGVRISMGIAWMTLVAAEFTGVQQGYGLGYMIMTARDLQRLDMIMAGMAVIGFIGIAIEHCLGRIARYLLRWR
jgi:ABC-type nitrate/sulfonate/bicarbonate transport system permease component